MLKKIAAWFTRPLERPSDGSAGAGSAKESPRCQRCENAQAVHVTRVKLGKITSEAHFCLTCAQESLWIPSSEAVGPLELAEPHREIAVEVETLIISEVHDTQMIIFREIEGSRRLPFVLGIFEATMVDRTIKGLPSPRPVTHDAWLDTIARLGASVKAASVYDRKEEIYFARLQLSRAQELIDVDMRPSDALVVALKARVPFLFNEKILAENSVSEPEPA